MAETIPKSLRDRVAKKARHRCGYCLTDQRVSGAQMHIEHIIPRARGGQSTASNLWLSCAWCNSFKGTQIEAVDTATGAKVALFNPRTQKWLQHFAWGSGGTRITGLSQTGRATIGALKLNNPYIGHFRPNARKGAVRLAQARQPYPIASGRISPSLMRSEQG